MTSNNDDVPAGASALYARFGPALHRYALMILANRQDSEDAVQQVFMTLVRRGTAHLDSPEAYLRTAVRNECFSALRRRRDTPEESRDSLLESASPGGGDAEELLALEMALQTLPPTQREVVHLKAYEGMTLQEIADLTTESINTIASRYRYGMTKLRSALRGTSDD